MKKMKYFKTWTQVVFAPMEFWEELPKKIRYKEPTIFAIKTFAIMMGVVFFMLAVMAALFSGITGTIFGGTELAVLGTLGAGVFFLILLAYLVMLLLQWAGLYIGAGMTHLFVLLLGGKQRYQETFKVYSYSFAPMLIGFIPVLGSLAGIYSLVLMIMGVHVRQKLSVGKAIAAALLPAAVFILFIFFIIMEMVLLAKLV